jgi:predicted enzyme related to lactoylglutathione lyase
MRNIIQQLKWGPIDKKIKMKKIIFALTIIATIISCDLNSNKSKIMEEQKNQSDKKLPQEDTTPKVTGIGGVFFFSENPEKTKEWYSENLGLEVNQWGSSFEFRNANRPDEINYLQWSPFKQGSEYFAPSKKEFMINYRVQNIEGLVKKLKDNGVTIVDSIETFDYGKFVHIMDEEGNKIELWEPIDSVFTAMGGKTTK